jgi:copper(I)-binding protein
MPSFIDASAGAHGAGTRSDAARRRSVPDRVNTVQHAAIPRRSWVAAALLAWLAGEAAAATVAINSPWVRVATDGRTAEVYMEILSSETALIVGASTPAARRVAIRRPEGSATSAGTLPLPAGGAVSLAPGRARIELSGLLRPLSRGERIALTLTIRAADGSEREIPIVAEVRRRSAIDDHRQPHAR